MRQLFSAAPGQSLPSVALSGGTVIRGISIDNPTGSWLLVQNSLDYIPPYTLGWSKTLEYSAPSLTVLAGNGPTGQVGTATGSNWTLTIDSDPVTDSLGSPAPGTAFVATGTDSIQQVASNILCPRSGVGGGSPNIIVPLPNQRVRIYLVEFTTNDFSDNGGATVQVFDTPITTVVTAAITRDKPNDRISFGETGLDFPLGSPISAGGLPIGIYVSTFVGVVINYRLI